jgi:hypothetical protein
MALNISGNNLVCNRKIDRPGSRLLAKNMNIWMIRGLSCRGLVAFLINYDADEAERRLVVCSAYLPYDSEEPLQTSDSEERNKLEPLLATHFPNSVFTEELAAPTAARLA